MANHLYVPQHRAPGAHRAPELAAPASPEAKDANDPFKFLTVEALTDMRREQKNLVDQAKRDAGIAWYDRPGELAVREQTYDTFDDLHAQVLAANGVKEEDDNYKDYLGYLQAVSINNMTDTDWYGGEKDENGNLKPSGRDTMRELHDNLAEAYRSALPPTPDTTPQPTPDNNPTQVLYTQDQLNDYIAKVETKNQLKQKVNEARTKVAQLTLKRQGKIFVAGNTASPEYEQAYEEYNIAMFMYAKAGEEYLGNNRTDDEKNASVVAYLLYEGQTLRQEVNDQWAGTTQAKVCEWLARGGFARRALKGIVLGAGVAAAGGALTAATGGLGTAGIVAGGAATAAGVATRFMRGYGVSRGKAGGMAGTLTAEKQAAIHDAMYGGSTTSQRLAAGLYVFHRQFEQDTVLERQKGRRAAALGAVSVVLGAGLTAGLKEVADATNASQYIDAALDKALGHKPEVSWHPGEAPQTGGGTPETPTPSPNTADHVTPGQLETLTHVQSGEGGIQLLHELNPSMTEQDWYNMEDDLLKAHPNDFYRMPDGPPGYGHVGISHPGQLSESAMRDLAQRAKIWKP